MRPVVLHERDVYNEIHVVLCWTGKSVFLKNEDDQGFTSCGEGEISENDSRKKEASSEFWRLNGTVEEIPFYLHRRLPR